MRETLVTPRRRVGPDDRARPGLRRLLAMSLLSLAAAAMLMLVPAFASADTASTLTVDGTSDVSDSGLMPNLIGPEFEAAYPQFTFKYNGSATGTAILNAETGTGGPSVLIVHAASLENQFVQDGFSYNNQYGNAIFRNDFVLAGTNGDVAGVTANAANNIAQAFADVATAGVAGTATFMSRGGTNTAPGTTVAEHGIWQLVNSSGLTPTGVVLCDVSAADGGGMTPISPTVQATSGSACPDTGTVIAPDLPNWYQINSGNQANNVTVANACTGTSNGATHCYVLTDRGTFDYLSDGGTAAGGPSTIANLAIVTRDNSPSAPGGADELINYFHAYIINPSVSGETVNLTAAEDFVNFLTSPTVQAQLKNYLANTADPGGPPFVADASPTITASGFPSVVNAGQAVTVTGAVSNAEPGYATPANQPVAVDQIVGGIPVAVGSSSTNGSGAYSITFTPRSSGSYQVSTGAISLLENTTLNPWYGDILSPGASAASTIAVQGGVSIAIAQPYTGGLTVAGGVTPGAPDGNATVTVLDRQAGSTGAFSTLAVARLTAGETTYAVSHSLAPGTWQIEATYADPNQFVSLTTATKTVTVSQSTTSVTLKRATAKTGKITVTGTLSQGSATSGAKVELFALATTKVKITGKRAKRSTSKPKVAREIVLARAAAVSFKQVGKTSVAVGKRTFTVKAKLKRGYHYVLQLEYIHSGQTSTYSKLGSPPSRVPPGAAVSAGRRRRRRGDESRLPDHGRCRRLDGTPGRCHRLRSRGHRDPGNGFRRPAGRQRRLPSLHRPDDDGVRHQRRPGVRLVLLGSYVAGRVHYRLPATQGHACQCDRHHRHPEQRIAGDRPDLRIDAAGLDR
jgi:tungstate transport system substrate-binding protein